MAEGPAYLLAALAFSSLPYVLLRLLVVAALSLCDDALAVPERPGAPGGCAPWSAEPTRSPRRARRTRTV